MLSLKDKLIYFLGLFTVAILNILAINNYAYDKNGKIQCDNYVLNTYLYVILGIIIMATVILVDERFNILANVIMQYNLYGLIVIIIVLFLFTYLLNSTTNQIMSHIYWIILMSSLGLLLSIPMYIYSNIDMNIIYYGIAITIVITAFMAIIGNKFGSLFITEKFDKFLKWALLGLIIASLFAYVSNIPNIWTYISIAGVIIFSLLILSYNNKIRENAKNCVKPLYTKESFGLLIKIINLLQDVMYLVARRSRR